MGFGPPFFSGPSRKTGPGKVQRRTPLPIGEETRTRIAERLRDEGVELCHVEWKASRRDVLTLFIDREEGVTLDDCERASRTAEEILDAEPGLGGPYSLEVSSPGLDRPLWTLGDCQRFAGRRVTVRLLARLEGTTRLKGVLEKVDGGLLTVLDEDQRRRYTVRFGDVKLARLVPEL